MDSIPGSQTFLHGGSKLFFRGREGAGILQPAGMGTERYLKLSGA